MKPKMISTLVAVISSATIATAGEWWSASTNPPPSLAPVFGDGADTAWAVSSGKFTVTDDPALGKKVLTATDGLALEGKTWYTGDQELRALVRFPSKVYPNLAATFYLAKGETNAPVFYANMLSYKTYGCLQCSTYQKLGQTVQSLNDLKALTDKLDWATPVQNDFSCYLHAYRSISPGWPEDFRVRVEHDMASLPDFDQKWIDLRIELRKGHIRFWLDDHLVSQKSDPAIKPEGTASINLGPSVQLASYRIKPLGQPVRRFSPVRIGGYANGLELMDKASVLSNSLPPDDSLVRVQGVPFLFSGTNPEGHDHLDISKSLYREANMEGYYPASDVSWIGSTYRDPARIQLRIPNAQFDSLYLIAASDDDPSHIPLVTAMFYRPGAGFSEQFEGTVPSATSKHPSPQPLPQGERRSATNTAAISSPLGGEDKGEGYSAISSEAKPLPVTLTNGKKVNLWLVKIPLDPEKLTSLSDLDVVEIELTKKVYQYRGYPDPIMYGWHQGGRPSAVHVYAVTLGEAPFGFDWQPDKFGHVWLTPDVPSYTATVTNRTDAALAGTITVVTRSYDGTEETKQEKPVTVAQNTAVKVPFPVPVKLNGYHDITATLQVGGKTWTEKRSFVRLAPDTRAPRWTEGKGVLFGYWSYHGGHYTPKAEHVVELMTMAGGRTSIGLVSGGSNTWIQAHWSRVAAGAWEISPQPWAAQDPYDPAKYEEYKKTVLKLFTDARNAVPEQFRADHVYFFPEPHVSQRLTEGNIPTYWGEPYWEYTKEEKERLRMFFVTAKCAAEVVRSQWPDLKIMIPYGDALFIPPLLRAGFPKNLIDGSGIDTPTFERIPEQQLHQISPHRFYMLRKEYEKAGIPNPNLFYCEGTFVPTEPGACTWQEQMDYNNRWALISMGYGVKRFYSGWFAFDCGSYYGAEHYGGCGIQRRIPYCDPKPGYAAFATMTDKLDQADFDGWLKTGSLTTFCQRFKGPKGFVYPMWSIRGKRPVTLTLTADADVSVTDSMNNTRTIKAEARKATFLVDPDVRYVTTAGEIASVDVGEPDNSDVVPAKDATVVADLGDGSWNYSSQRDLTYENNNYDTLRYPGKFSASVSDDPKQGKVLASKLEKQDKVHELMPWYNTLVPRKPITLAGAPSHLGLWVKGASDWGRVIYCLRDAKGERWISVGTKDQYNCDDVHSSSAFNFDGWRYLRFELPGHVGYDDFRKIGTTWWGSHDGDGIVDLPLTLEKIIVEQRSHILYVNDVQPVASDTVCFGKLSVEYQKPEDATPEAVRLSKLRMPLPTGTANLPNPIADMSQSGVGAPTEITKLEPPLEHNDGTQVLVHFKEVPEGKTYFVWCSAHEDGRAAVNMTTAGAKDGAHLYWLRPGVKLYFWVTYQDAKGQTSKPSKVASTMLVDTFKEK